MREKYADLDTFNAERKKLILPEFEKLKVWLIERIDRVPPQSLLGKAINYALKEWQKLIRYVDCPLLTPSTNMIENTIRSVVIGRKNFLFGGSPDGAKAIANIYSLSETSKAYGLDPFKYFRFVFEKLPLAKTAEEIKRLLPQYLDLREYVASQKQQWGFFDAYEHPASPRSLFADTSMSLEARLSSIVYSYNGGIG